MQIVREKIELEDLREMAESGFGDLVKAVVDIKKEIMVVGGALHSDQESLLLKEGSKQEDLWGINLYPEKDKESWIDFDSMINLRPYQGNNSRGVEDLKIRLKITEIIIKLVKR